jgi:transposase
VKITESDVIQAWDELLAPRPKQVHGRGKTLYEIAEEAGIARSTAYDRVAKAMRKGRLQCIGVRPGTQQRVYDVVESGD